VGAPPLAAHQKNAREAGATLAFSDETGFLLLPLVRTTLAPRGHTPVLAHRARHRDKVSAAAALTLSPVAGRVGLHCLALPDGHVDETAYAYFLRSCVLPSVRGPLVLLHDNGHMHHGPAVRDLARRHPRLTLERLPAYAPEYNPCEAIWDHLKYHELANFVPADVPELLAAVCNRLTAARLDQGRLRSFLLSSPLPWSGTAMPTGHY
jgi:transposase